ncbi:MAG: biotin/lipoyl-containing protein [Endomicrobiia bacterium]
MIKIDQLKEYVEFLKTTDIEELEIETVDGEKFHLKRSDVVAVQDIVPPQGQNGKNGTAVIETEKNKNFVVKSPMVGKFLISTSKDHPPFVVEGAKVKQGQKLAIIETMKMFKDVISQVSGTVKKILVEDEKFVEYGQDLIIIEVENNK